MMPLFTSTEMPAHFGYDQECDLLWNIVYDVFVEGYDDIFKRRVCQMMIHH